MSKSLGNVVHPNHLLECFGADFAIGLGTAASRGLAMARRHFDMRTRYRWKLIHHHTDLALELHQAVSATP